jgi:hypothetical protein
MPVFHPALQPVNIIDLLPTQMTVGYREISQKRKEWCKLVDKQGSEFLGRHLVPIIQGRKDRMYMIDHHHLVRALYEEGVKKVLTNVIADLSRVDKDSFWTVMDIKGWCHPYNSDGVRVDYDKMPKTIDKLVDDPYRSLAGELRKVGGYAKDVTVFSEFIWADFLRRHIKRKEIADTFDEALKDALILAKSKYADYLPGWCGAR